MKFFMQAFEPQVLSIFRIITGFLFMPHGAQKLFGMLGKDPVDPYSLIGVAGFLEFFGGLLIMIGLFTRPVAFLLSGLMAVAYFMAHARQSFWPIDNGGELAALYSFVFLYLAAAGAGPWSLDALLFGKKEKQSDSPAG